MKLIVGLGNPGIEYQFTPHNLGFLAIDRIAERSQCRGEEPAVPGVNRPHADRRRVGSAGQAGNVHELERSCGTGVAGRVSVGPEADLIVIYDELDLPLGTIRIRQRGSSAGHNGMESIIGRAGHAGVLADPVGNCAAPRTKMLISRSSKRQLKVVDESAGHRRRSGESDFDRRPGAAMNGSTARTEEGRCGPGSATQKD